MIDRVAGPAVSEALAVGEAKAAQPRNTDFSGMPFEVPSVIAALFGCIVTRVILGQSDKVAHWLVRVRVDVLSGGVIFFLVISTHPPLLTALVLGITVATLGATIIKMAEVRGRNILDALLPGGGDDEAAMASLTDKLHRIPDEPDQRV